MKSNPWVIAGGILLFCRPKFSILLFLPPVLFTVVLPEVLPSLDRTDHKLPLIELPIPRRRWQRWVCIGEENPFVNTPNKINNNNLQFFPKAPSNPDRTSPKTGLKYISFIVNVMLHSLIRSAGCLSAICSLPWASACHYKIQHWLSNDWQNIFPPV